MSDIIYKYTDSEGAKKILSNCTLRFVRPQEMNDPFDIYIGDLFGMDLREFFEESSVALFDTLADKPQVFAKKIQIPLEEAIKVTKLIKDMPADKKEALRKTIGTIDLTEFDSTFSETQENLKKSRDEFAEKFKNYGVFCATETCCNLLMWAHYAEQHRGVVVGLKPDLEKDSFLRLMEPVKYKDERPFLFESTAKWLNSALEEYSMEIAREASHRLLHTKSSEWSYEKELRLAIPDEVKPGQVASFLKFYSHELAELYLGYRMSDENKVTVVGLAKQLNPNVRIFNAKLAKRKYALDFEEI